METNGMPGGMMPGMLRLEMPLHQHSSHHPHQQTQQQQQQQQPLHPLQMVPFSSHEPDHHPQQQQQQSVKTGSSYPYNNNNNKPKQQHSLSEEDEPGFHEECGGDPSGVGCKRGSPWQRMKWTDNMVRLLIMVVYYVGDDGGSETNDPSGKKKPGGLLQKKGKWKAVSRAMMEKGFYVSPQQCEDKFNDLNKRYKRVNDILGKGTACRVVENQSLLDTMDQLSPKMKEEARKLLNSKHLFFREMCAYHSSCASAAVHQSGETLDSTHQQQQQQQRCFHSSETTAISAAVATQRSTSGIENSKVSVAKIGNNEEDDEEEEDDDDDEDDEDNDDEEDMDDGGNHSDKRQRRLLPSSPSLSFQHLNSELMSMMQDGTKSPWEQRQWIQSKSVQMEEHRVNYQCQALELEKQRFKWLKFSGKKEREMEKLKLENERMRLENERMLLLLHQKEMELERSDHRPSSLHNA